jgi:hypothetical protein
MMMALRHDADASAAGSKLRFTRSESDVSTHKEEQLEAHLHVNHRWRQIRLFV